MANPPVRNNRSHQTALYTGRDQGPRFYPEEAGNRPGHSGHHNARKTERPHVLPLHAPPLSHLSSCRLSFFFSQESYSEAELDPSTGKSLEGALAVCEGRGLRRETMDSSAKV